MHPEDRYGPDGRYAKQVLFAGIGPEGQSRIGTGDVVVVGLGALGCASATQLARGGVGRLRLIDRDVVEWSNLQRQTLYDEADARRRLPKAVSAAERLRAANSSIDIIPHVADVTPRNVEELLAGCDLVVDGTDNLETRFLLNDACVKRGIPWVYGGAVGSSGSVMAIVPGRTACLRCLLRDEPDAGLLPTCETEGVLAAAPGVVGSLQAAAALQLLVGVEPSATLICFDVWEPVEFHTVAVLRREDCPVCGAGRYEYLEGQRFSWTTALCGRNSVQISPPEGGEIRLDRLAERLSAVGDVEDNGFTLSLRVDGREVVVFPDGRAIVHGTTDVAEARSLYARYVGR